MRFRNKYSAIFILLLAMSISGSSAAADTEQQPILVEIQNRAVTVEARDVSIRDVLHEIGKKIGTEIKIYEGVEDRKINFRIEDVPLDEVHTVFTRMNIHYVYGQEKDKPGKILFVLPKGKTVDLPPIERLAFSSGDAREMNYERKIIKTFTWGSGDDQLGSNWREYRDDHGNYIGSEDAWSQSCGPSKILVDKLNRILVADDCNTRTFVLDPISNEQKVVNGFLNADILALDSNNSLYVLNWGTLPSRIYRFGADFILDEIIYFDTAEYRDFIPSEMFVSMDGKISIYAYSNKITITPVSSEEVAGIGSEEKRISNVDLEPFKREKSRDKYLFKDSYLDIEIPVDLNASFGDVYRYLGVDKSNYNYLLVGKREISTADNELYVQRYGDAGLGLEIKIESGENLYYDYHREKLVGVDSYGNIYQLMINKSGPQLIKWELR